VKICARVYYQFRAQPLGGVSCETRSRVTQVRATRVFVAERGNVLALVQTSFIPPPTWMHVACQCTTGRNPWNRGDPIPL